MRLRPSQSQIRAGRAGDRAGGRAGGGAARGHARRRAAGRRCRRRRGAAALGRQAAVTRLLAREPAPAPAAPAADHVPAAGAGEPGDRAAIDKALESRAPADVHAIANVRAATEGERLTLIRILVQQGWVGPRDEAKLMELWGSFGDTVGAVAAQDLKLWDDCREAGASLERLPAVQRIRDRFKEETLRIALGNLDKNEHVVDAELARYGLSKEKDVAVPDVSPEQTGMPRDEERAAQLRETKELAGMVQQLQKYLDGFRATAVGKAGEPFNPDRPPVEDIRIGEQTSWELVKRGYDDAQGLLARILNAHPALFAAVGHGSEFVEGLAGADPDKDPEGMLKKIRTNLLALQQDARAARRNLGSGRCDYRTLKPVHAAVRGGAPWSDPFHAWVTRNDVKGYEDREYWVDLGVKTASAAALIAAELATLGGATFMILTGVGLGASAAHAAHKEDKFETLSTAHAANAGLNRKDQVDAAEAEAEMAKVAVAVDLVTGLGAGALAAERAAAKAKAPAAAGEEPVPPGGAVPAAAGGSVKDPGWVPSQVWELAARTPEGAHAHDVFRRAKTTLRTGPGRLAYYLPNAPTPTIYIGQGYSPVEASIAFVHEMNHLEERIIKAIVPKPTAMERGQYIAAKCAEEARSAAREVRHSLGLQRGDPTLATHRKTEQVYRAAYLKEVTRVRAAAKDLPEVVLRTVGDEAGERALYEAHMDGTFKTSTSGGSKSYAEHFGERWDRHNAPPAGGGGTGTPGTVPGPEIDDPGPPADGG